MRTHFLLFLNGQYEGQATGETFNANGKTDILIRVDGKNIFVAECKFWKGSKAFSETIDQLLGYLSWRDTKAAILLFNKRKNTSSVLAQITEVAAKHPNFRKQISQNGSEFRFSFSNATDKDKELIVTVIVFDIPSPES